MTNTSIRTIVYIIYTWVNRIAFGLSVVAFTLITYVFPRSDIKNIITNKVITSQYCSNLVIETVDLINFFPIVALFIFALLERKNNELRHALFLVIFVLLATWYMYRVYNR